MSLLTNINAFFADHLRCGGLKFVDGPSAGSPPCEGGRRKYKAWLERVGR